MPGSVVDLSVTGTPLPDLLIVDTNLIVEHLVIPYLAGLPTSPLTVNAQRAGAFFHTLITGNGTGLVTPVAFQEFIHVAVKFRYNQARLQLGPGGQNSYGRAVKSWLELYKQDPSILQAFRPNLEQLRRLSVANGLLFLAPEDLGPITSGRSYDEELLHLVGTYGLDSSDAVLLLEAQRYGVTDIATLDADLLRASTDFTIYTWR